MSIKRFNKLAALVHKVLLTDPRMDSVAAIHGRCLLLGFSLLYMVISLLPGLGFGLYTGFMLMAFGVFSMLLSRWRSEPGLWMLASLLFVIYGIFYFCLQVDIFAQLVQNVPVKPRIGWIWFGRKLDSLIAFFIFGMLLRFLLTVIVRNFQLSMWLRTVSRRRLLSRPIRIGRKTDSRQFRATYRIVCLRRIANGETRCTWMTCVRFC